MKMGRLGHLSIIIRLLGNVCSVLAVLGELFRQPKLNGSLQLNIVTILVWTAQRREEFCYILK